MTVSAAPAPSMHRRSTTLLGLALPLIILVSSAVLAWSWKDTLPDPVATHWGTDGVDGFGSLTGAIAVILVIGVLVTILLWAISFRTGKMSSTRRMVNGLNVWTAVLLSTILLGTLHAQKGLIDAADVGGVGGTIALGMALATVAGVLVAVVTPACAAAPATDRVPADASRLPLGDGERAVWFQRPRGGVGLAVGFLAAAGTGVAAIATSDWWMLLVTASLVALMAAMFSWVARVDEAGLHVRSSLGVPRTHIPLDEILQARATTVRCFREFGGWGWRIGRDGRVGVVLRSGDALEVTRTGGGVFVVTVDDAQTGAALLNTLADRARATHPVE
ncbi:Protein of unknown function [Sanguibacter gelidistatuariae]|uniref:DUF1648 domain-containing protein n=1 Tax=Sanguibacter gelidistatuariae TaxID=1814289 RepID=A0A1G6N9Z0_9MICO|nr:DUF1648 domain-containing protein [Sanguibacter gelidistatuariae]SDC64638.1 Protein of unknown function [Sanguibacter gelidistatuariae]